MSDNTIPTGEYKGSTAATDKIFQWQDYIVNSDDKEFKSFLEHCDCPYGIHTAEPCKEKPFKLTRINFVSRTYIWNQWMAIKLLRLAFWLGKIEFEGIEDA